MLDLVVKDGRAVGIVARNLITGAITLALRARGRARHRRLRQRLLPLDEREGAATSPPPGGRTSGARCMANPCYTQIHPTCIPRERRLPVEAHADERVAAQRRPHLGAAAVRRHALARPDPRGRARLLPRAPLPRVRQPRAARRRVTRREARGRRRSRRRAAEERRLPRLRRGDPAPRHGRHRGALRQPLPDVRAHHRRGPVQGPDAHLPRRPLHDGRALGRLQPDEQRARAVRARRGELLRPRRQPARRQRARCRASPTATSCSRPRSTTTSRRCSARSRSPTDDPAFREAEADVADQTRAAHVDERQPARSTTSTASSARSCGTTAAWPAARESLEKAIAEIPALREEFWADVRVLGENETLNQSLEKAGRVADFLEFGELLVPRRPATARRAAAATSGSSTRPRRARRCATTTTSRTSPRGSTTGVGTRADAPQGAARVRVRPPRAASYK